MEKSKKREKKSRGNKRTQRKDFNQSRENKWKRSKSDDSADATSGDANNAEVENWKKFKTENAAFDKYYKEQGIVPAEEWDTFMKCLRTPLPAAFRINSSSQFYKDILFRLENDIKKSLPAEDTDGNAVEAIKVLPWYPDNLAWQSIYSRNELRKTKALEEFHEFLKLENETGNITRQEAVSMVPPLFLDVRPDHFVLDMCAAPGSKTFQLLEMIYALTEPGTLPSGMVIANDVDVKRCNLLIHQTKRMCTANLIVTNHEAQHFPSCKLYRNLENVKELGICQLEFDRVLCDVPCSGDGTLRKAPDMWKNWKSGMANGLFGLQVQIAMRGLALLKVGGRMVYSTCSMNPVENEAVVAEVLRRCKGTVELVDVSTELPELARRPGIKKWKVCDDGLWLTSYKDARKDGKSVATPGMFPSGNSYDEISERDQETTTGQDSNENNENKGELMDDSVAPTSNLEAEVSDLPLEHCMRIVPHDQNSGAFFIAVFNKLLPLPAPMVMQKKSKSRIGSSAESKIQMNGVKEDKNGDNIDASGETNVQISEAATNVSLLDTGIGETHLITDQSKIHKQNDKNDKNGDDMDVTGETDVQISEAVLDASLLDSGIGETHLITDQSKIHEQNEKNDKNGDDIDVSGETDVQISEAAPDASLLEAGIGETHLITDQSKIHEQNEKNDKNGNDIDASGETDVLISEAAPDAGVKKEKEDAKAVPGKRKLQMQGRWRGVDPVIFYKDETVVSKIVEFYGIKESFPIKGHLITRNSDMSHVKRIYYVSNSVNRVLELNLLGGQQLKIASVGLKLFERQTSKEGSSAPCLFRISSEGLPLILPHITKQLLYASPIDFKHLLTYKSLKFVNFVDPVLREVASELLLGCCVVILRTEGWVLSSRSGGDATAPIAIGCWKGRTNISIMVNANDCRELLEMVSMLQSDEAMKSDGE